MLERTARAGGCPVGDFHVQSKIHIHAALFLLLALGCSRSNTGLRSGDTETSSQGDDGTGTSAKANDGKRPSDAGEGVLGYTEAHNPVPIYGSNLVEILISVQCVGIQDEPTPSCKNVRLNAKVKVNDEEPVRFAADTVTALGIKSSSWKIGALDDVTCQFTGPGFEFNPKCSSNNSLEHTIIKATLVLVGRDGSTHQGDSPNKKPTLSGGVVGNFMLLDASAGLTPSNLPAGSGASAEFSQIWAVLKGGEVYLDDLKHVSYVTNILYDAGNALSGPGWGKSKSLCASVNSGDGAGKWHLPEILELCGANYASSACDGGINKHGIKNVTFAGGSWSSINYLWSSSPATSGNAWFADLSNGSANSYDVDSTYIGVLCVR